MKQIALFVVCAVIVAVISCTGDLNWTEIKFPCSASRPCADGFKCGSAGHCIPVSAVDDAGSKDTNPVDTYNPDSPYRPAILEPKLAFLYVGPVGDFGWTWAHEQGRLHLEKLGYKTKAIGPVAVSDADKQIDAFVTEGFDFVVGTSHDFLLSLVKKAAQYPNRNFLTCSGFETSRNMGSYFGRLYQVEWLAGMIAGATTKTNRIGVVTTIAIPEIIRHVNAFTRGVRHVNPNAIVIVKWIGNWFDVKLEPIVTKELLEANADIIHSHTDTSIPLEVIENKSGEPLKTKDGNKVYTIAYNSINGCNFGPRTCLASAYWNWGPVLARMLEKVKKGTWDPAEIIWEQIKTDKQESGHHLALSEKLSADIPGNTRVELEGLIPKLAKEGLEGQRLPFMPPLKDNTGKVRYPDGQFMSDKNMLDVCWFIEGVMEPDGTTASKVPAECKWDR